jgi:glutathione synthase/RimK-type ligase-like ATP-grasp enzyme
MRVAIASCRMSPDAGDDEVYPDDDNVVLAAALEAVGASVAIIAWDHRTTDWDGFDAVVLRSTWDSVDRPEDFRRWVGSVGAATTLLNPPEAIEWNLDKIYLRELAARGVPVVPTEWVTEATVARWWAPRSEIVVKPSISGGGRETARHAIDRGDEALAHIRRLLAAGQTAMVQPYLDTVETDGEIKLVFIDGRFSHAVRVGPSLRPHEGVRERPWERPVATDAATPSPAQLDLARQVLSVASETFPGSLTYARVDLIAATTGEPLLAELELIDPSLFLTLAPTSAEVLAAAIVRGAGRAHARGRP